MTPAWLTEFHRRWYRNRGKKVAKYAREFSAYWVELLESVGITRVEDQSTAMRELKAYEKGGHFVIKHDRGRKDEVYRLELPFLQEVWLRDLFGGIPAQELQARSLAIVAEYSDGGHERFTEEWTALCESLQAAFTAARTLRPFNWRHPETLRRMLGTVKGLSERQWPVGTFIRVASVEIGLGDKGLEHHKRSYEAGLTRMFGTAVSMKDLGFATGDSQVDLHGPLRLHFPDGSMQDFENLTQVIISAADLVRCTSISTTAERLLTIENRKTTFRQYAAANQDRRTLIATTSFPTPAFRDLLEKLPANLPHHHFGDTDPAGWHILLKLREATPREVAAFQMKWRPAVAPIPLTPYDHKLLEKLLSAPLLSDVRGEIRTIAESGDRGDFVQETLGPPTSSGWPFAD